MIPSSLYFFIIGFLSYYSTLIENILLLILKQFGLHRYNIMYDKDILRPLLKKIETECMSLDTTLFKGNRKTLSGWFFNTNIVGLLTYNGVYEPVITISFVSSESYFNYLMESPEEKFCSLNETNSKKIQSKISVFSRCGDWKSIRYSRFFLNVTSIQPVLDQELIVRDIVNFYTNNQQCKVFIEGPPCSGKSSIGYLVAKEINGSFCNTFNPTEPGDTLSNLISMVQDLLQDNDTPLVLLIDEVDTLLKKIHNNQIKLNDKISTLVTDKPSWSKFVDNLKFSKNLILIFTSNTSKEDIDKLDHSYIRKGRIDLYRRMVKSVYTEDGKFIGDPF